MVHKIITNNDHENLMISQQMFSLCYNPKHVRFFTFRRYIAKTGIAKKNFECCFQGVLSDGKMSGELWPHRSSDLNREIFVFVRDDKG